MTQLPTWAWVAAVLAGALGALLRTFLVRSLARHVFPLGVLVANTLASAIGGGVVGLRPVIGPGWAFVLIGGLCGGLSTLSTLAVDTVELRLEGRWRVAVRNVVVTVVLGVAAAWGVHALVS